jgi:hypothetical protein
MAVSFVLIFNAFAKSTYFTFDHFKKIQHVCEKEINLPLQSGRVV